MYEHLIILVRYDFEKSIQEQLNDFGKQGWELVHFGDLDKIFKTHQCIFKRSYNAKLLYGGTK